ncbi:hypothetical protein [Veronia pacifica]|uniref:Uncharacterized protein n=1 Tax=Veronia pacifica TaxID=1080227 RepID=A0A1C3EJ89_9GAMM|nr:hypothetical protein [Veronia pacifica]ODA33302.1 hypothetical protein A8L45_10920 [Veronia pacifica]
MDYLQLIGTRLKSDFLIDLFETYDVDVTYEYDRLHESEDDSYTAFIPELGLEFSFDSEQRLVTLFMTLSQADGYNPFEGIDPRTAPFGTAAEALVWANDKSLDASVIEASSHPIFGETPESIRIELETLYIHYSFEKGTISKVTLGSKNS